MGDNHPDCSEIRVDVADDASASLLQARLNRAWRAGAPGGEPDTISWDW